MRLRNFPGITYSESPEGIIRIFWRENGRQFNRTFHSWTSVMSFLGTLYPQLATHRVEQSKVVQPVASLNSELIWYQGRLVRSRQQDDSEHKKTH